MNLENPYLKKLERKILGTTKVKIFGHEVSPRAESENIPLHLSETCISVSSEQELVNIRNFLNKCIREMKNGKFTGKNGEHRHFSHYMNPFGIHDPDIIIAIHDEEIYDDEPLHLLHRN